MALDPREIIQQYMPTILQFAPFLVLLESFTYGPSALVVVAIIAFLGYLAGNVAPYLSRFFVSTAEVHINDEVYNYLVYWLSREPFSNNTRTFVATSRTDSDFITIRPDDSDGEDDDDSDTDMDPDEEFDDYWKRTNRRDKIKRLNYTPALGTHYFWHKGRLLKFRREREKSSVWSERLYLSCLGRDPTPLKQLLEEAQADYIKRDASKTIIYQWSKGSGGDGPTWVRCMARHPRPLSTVILDAKQKEGFLNDVKDYLHPFTRRWYTNRGIPYRRGYLFYGPPGTGKTSLCFAVAGQLGLKIYVLSLNSRQLTEEGLAALFAALPRRCIVLLEDIDTAGITKLRTDTPVQITVPTEAEKSKKLPDTDDEEQNGGEKTPQEAPEPVLIHPGISLSALLNTIDGVASSEGRILVMTTNHIKNLDSALLRPGRVDMTISFGYADRQTIEELYKAIYTDDSPLLSCEADRPDGKGPSTTKTKSTQLGSGENTQPNGRRCSILQHTFSPSRIAAFAKEFANRVPAGKLTPAQIQGYLLGHKNAPEDAVQKVSEWVASCGAEPEPARDNEFGGIEK